jgi:ATP-binding cassette subfamily G (WHITE) protein 2 (SNQ2)
MSMSRKPIRYGFEGLMSNEFHKLNGKCSDLIPIGPGYENVTIANQVCVAIGAIPGQDTVDGNRFIELSYDYSHSHLLRVSGVKHGSDLHESN